MDHYPAIRPDGSSIGVVVVDHGSRRPDANLRHEAFVRQWGYRLGFAVVEPAHMESAEPSIGAAFDACVAAGADTVVIAPFFLWPGTHWSRDIPALAAEAAERHRGVQHLVAAPLGPDLALMDVVGERVHHCMAHASGLGPECELCAGSGRCHLR